MWVRFGWIYKKKKKKKIVRVEVFVWQEKVQFREVTFKNRKLGKIQDLVPLIFVKPCTCMKAQNKFQIFQYTDLFYIIFAFEWIPFKRIKKRKSTKSTDHQTWDGIFGKHGIGKCNNNCILLLKTCAAPVLAITNTTFRLPTRNKTSWMHPRSKHWHLIDYVITRKREQAGRQGD